MKKAKTKIINTMLAIALTTMVGATASAADKEFILQVENEVSGTDTEVEYELKTPDGTLVSQKSGTSGTISFDPIILDDADTTSHFYVITQKNSGVSGMTYDSKVVYARIVPSRNLVAYQDDTSYKYVNDGSGPHPYHATDEELQGQAYAVFDSKTKTLTFFRDEEGKYEDGYAERIMDGNNTEYKQYFTGFELENKNHLDSSGAARPSWSYGCRKTVEFQNPYYYHSCSVSEDTEKVIFKDAIRPEGAMNEWFYIFKNVKTADISKLDTSLVTNMSYFFYDSPNLTDIDLTHLDFRRMSEAFVNGESSLPWMSFMERASSAVPEFDFNNYDIVDMRVESGRPSIGSSTLLNSGLRYLNTTNLSATSGSAEFSSNYCLERVVVGDNFSFYRSNLDMEQGENGGYVSGNKGWLKIETGEINNFNKFMNYYNGQWGEFINPNMAGNYVRPTCNTTPVKFASNYSPSTDNPNTSDYLYAIAGIMLASGIGSTLIFRAKRR